MAKIHFMKFRKGVFENKPGCGVKRPKTQPTMCPEEVNCKECIKLYDLTNNSVWRLCIGDTQSGYYFIGIKEDAEQERKTAEKYHGVEVILEEVK